MSAVQEQIEVTFNGVTYPFPAALTDEQILAALAGVDYADYSFTRSEVNGVKKLWISPQSGSKG